MDYKHIDDDIRRTFANENLAQVEEEHARRSLAIQSLSILIEESDDSVTKESYEKQRTNEQKRVESLEAQMRAWNKVLDTIPSMMKTTTEKKK